MHTTEQQPSANTSQCGNRRIDNRSRSHDNQGCGGRRGNRSRPQTRAPGAPPSWSYPPCKFVFTCMHLTQNICWLSSAFCVMFKGLYNISPSLDLTYHMRFSKFVFTCLHLTQNTCRLSSAFCVMFKVHYILDYIYHHPLLHSSSPTLTLIEAGVPTLDDPHLANVCFSVTILSLGLPKGNRLSRVLVLKPNIEVLLMLSLGRVGYTIFFWSFIFQFLKPLWCIVTMLMPFISLIADIFTKGLPRILFDDFRTSLSVCEPPASTAGCDKIEYSRH
ncbi:hypothetical protein L195_g025389 [Trifolium pratense]|uniref:Uncharacterized protein n=1 Tax=Trifolium pratense TaxID=57577 RepID=A0A2K3NGC0_TRIPR|nr:hypothetical protein L195_g025389 [Trifolium pratense]